MRTDPEAFEGAFPCGFCDCVMRVLDVKGKEVCLGCDRTPSRDREPITKPHVIDQKFGGARSVQGLPKRELVPTSDPHRFAVKYRGVTGPGVIDILHADISAGRMLPLEGEG